MKTKEKSRREIKNKPSKFKSFKKWIAAGALTIGMIASLTSSKTNEAIVIDNEDLNTTFSDGVEPWNYKEPNIGVNDTDNSIEGPEENENEQEEGILTTGNEKFVLPAGLRYSEMPGGTGETGTADVNTPVKVYNRAIVEIDPDTNELVGWVHVAGMGNTWKDYEKETGITVEELEELMKNNPNLREEVCTQLEDMPLDIEATKGWGKPGDLIRYDREYLYENLENDYER